MLHQNEEKYREKHETIAGIDEAGRGPLAGPVVVAAVILNPQNRIDNLNDSKKISVKLRELLYEEIIQKALFWNVQIISPQKIDEINILQATLLGMEKTVFNLKKIPNYCLIDGNQIPQKLRGFSEAIVKGDGKIASIATASILAKVSRDRIMQKYHEVYPNYNFAKNKGYPTKEHFYAIQKYGITSIHRKSYKPISQLILDF